MNLATLIQYDVALQAAKNRDYGNSFDLTLDKYGLVTACIRMHDKINRLQSLQKKQQEVADESLFDTWLDLVNYSLMTVQYMCTNFDNVLSNGQKRHRPEMQKLLDMLEPYNAAEPTKLVEKFNDEVFGWIRCMKSPDTDIAKFSEYVAHAADYCKRIASVAFHECLQYDDTMLNPKYMQQ